MDACSGSLRRMGHLGIRSAPRLHTRPLSARSDPRQTERQNHGDPASHRTQFPHRDRSESARSQYRLYRLRCDRCRRRDPLREHHRSIRRASARIQKHGREKHPEGISDEGECRRGQRGHEKRRSPAGSLLRGRFFRGCGYECDHDRVRKDRRDPGNGGGSSVFPR